MKKITVLISNQPGNRVALIHYPDDPSSWIVRKWVRKGLCLKRTESKWFNRKDLAERYAKSIAVDRA